MNSRRTQNAVEREIKGYCAQCSCYCPTIAVVRDGKFVEVKPDKEHPNACALCPKGLAGPELVYNEQRLRFPMRRTKPKGAPDPGWLRISWDEALRTTATKLNEIKATWGPEAVAITRGGFASSPMSEVALWVHRLGHAFGTPNNLSTTYICQWHRDHCSGYTFGNPSSRGSAGRAEFERAGVIVIWGVNIHATRFSLLPFIKRGLERGAKLIVIDPRKTEIAAMADLWLQVRPGTDGALALSMINVLIEEKLYDYEFVKNWTTAPFLVRSDTGNFLKESDLTDAGSPSGYVVADAIGKGPSIHLPGGEPSVEPALDGEVILKLASGEEVSCKTAFEHLRELVSEYRPGDAERLTGISQEMIKDAARILAGVKPACWYSWNGIEQNTNASQTNRAICILYALTGDYDKPGGNVILPRLPVNSIDGHELLSPEIAGKRLGFRERPLGPAGTTGSIRAHEFYNAILAGKPYPVKGLIAFSGNMTVSNAPSMVAREALSKLDFHVQVELFLSPTAELADIVLPAASFWESWHVGTTVASLGTKAYVQLRPAVESPQHECWPDMKILFELAKKLGLGENFWNGDVEAAFNYQFAPANVTVEQLRLNPGGVSIDLPMEYQKYMKKDNNGKFIGFPTPSRRIELYSQTFKEYGYNPLPAWEEPRSFFSAPTEVAEKYPLILTGAKIVQYCHSQHRALPSLRKEIPYPFLEINSGKAEDIGCKDGDWIMLESPYGSVTMKAKLTDEIPYDVVCTQHGWWQACPELDLPGFDPYSSEGANINLLFMFEDADPISGSLPMKNYPCNVKKKPRV